MSLFNLHKKFLKFIKKKLYRFVFSVFLNNVKKII
jgi:hypothetical protein